ncbi:MAG: helix-turn-helix domain-containing protein [Desulfosarcina sp.]|nr:helix-turn-helix domain-containing protein [Desulfobacterales bacterium]
MNIKKFNEKKRSQIRLLAAKLMDEWQNADEVAHVLGCRRDLIKHWHQLFREGGLVALQSKNTVGRPSKLNTIQKAMVKEILFSRSPLEFGFDLALWTNRFILDLIETLYEVKLAMPSVNRLLESYGIATRKPLAAEALKDLFARSKSAANVKRGKMMHFFHYPIEINEADPGGHLTASSGIVLDRRKPPKNAWVAGAFDARNSKRFMVTYREPIDDQFVTFLGLLIHHVEDPINLIVAKTRHLDTPAINAFVSASNGHLRLIRYNDKPLHDGRITSLG